MNCVGYLQIKDMFYVQTMRLRPELAQSPFWVDMNGKVLCHSPALGELGIRIGTPARTARRIAPSAEQIPFCPEDFQELDELFCSIAYRFTPIVEPFHPGEIFLGLQHNGPAGNDCKNVAESLLAEVRDLGMTGVVGVAGSRLAARLIGRWTTLPYAHLPIDGCASFLKSRPVDCLWTIPKRLRERLEKLGVFKVGDLQRLPEQDLGSRFGREVGRQLYRAARGLDSTPLRTDWPPQALDAAVGFEAVDDREALVGRLSGLCSELSGKLRSAHKQCRRLRLEVRGEDAIVPAVETMYLTPPASGVNRLMLSAKRLLEKIEVPRSPEYLRLSAENLAPAVVVQPDLFTPVQAAGLGKEEFRAYLALRFGSETLAFCSEMPIAWRERMLKFY